MLGIFYTYDQNKKEMRAISSNGLIAEFLDQDQAIFSNFKILNSI